MTITPEELQRRIEAIRARTTVAGPDDPIYQSGLRLTLIPKMPPAPTKAFPMMEPLLPPPEEIERIKREVAEEAQDQVDWNPIPDDAIPFSDPDPAVMDEVSQQVMEERRQRREREKGGAE